MKKHFFIFFGLFFLFPLVLLPIGAAHCPLCTLGAVAAAGGAKMLGVDNAVIGVFIGAFAVSMGWMIANLLKKTYVKGQKWILILLSFVTTIFPVMGLFELEPLTIHLFGGYGSLFFRTYMVNTFFIGSIIGGGLLFVTPRISSWVTERRAGKMIPYQGIIITFVLLTISGGILQLVF